MAVESATGAEPAEPGFTLAHMLRAITTARPDAPAVTMDDVTLTFAMLDSRSSQVANVLRARGVGPGDRVAILDKNAPSFYEVMFATAKLGAALVGLNYRLSSREIAAIVEDAEPVVIFVHSQFRSVLPDAAPCIVLDGDYDGVRDSASESWSDDPVAPGDVAIQLYSSGTTGQPKGAMLTHANLSWTPKMGREFYRATPDSVNLVPSPLFHIGGVGYGLTTMGQGGHTVLMRDVRPEAMLALIERYRVTHSFMVPSVVQMLVEHPSLSTTDISSLQRIAYGGAAMNAPLLSRAIKELNCEFMAVYGMTETAGTVIQMSPKDHDPDGPRAYLLRSIGRGVPWLDIRIVDPLDGHESALGEVGEIWVRSPQNMVAYWRQPEQTAATLSEENWLKSGDAASRDADGYIFLHDRIKDMIVSGGENIYPAEVEKVMAGHPAILELAVIGVPSSKWGETVKAIVVLRPGFSAAPAELIEWTRQQLAHYKCPTSVDLVDVLPRNATGKVVKFQLRAMYGSAEPAVTNA